MKSYELTDKEIINYAAKDEEYCDLSISVGRWAIQHARIRG